MVLGTLCGAAVPLSARGEAEAEARVPCTLALTMPRRHCVVTVPRVLLGHTDELLHHLGCARRLLPSLPRRLLGACYGVCYDVCYGVCYSACKARAWLH